jgi:hypothetical protein
MSILWGKKESIDIILCGNKCIHGLFFWEIFTIFLYIEQAINPVSKRIISCLYSQYRIAQIWFAFTQAIARRSQG